MQKCPVEQCERRFDSQSTLLEHLKRRHARHFPQFNNNYGGDALEKQQEIEQQVRKLPQIKGIRQASKEHKNIEFYRKSLSKAKPSHSQVTDANSVIQTKETRRTIEVADSHKLIRRPSLGIVRRLPTSKDLKPTNQQNKHQKLKKFEVLQSINKSAVSNNTKEDSFYTTAPGFSRPVEKKIVSFRALDKVKESGRASSTLRQKSEAVVGNHELLTASKLKRLQSEEEGVGRQARRTGETLLSRVQLSAKDLVRDGRSANKSQKMSARSTQVEFAERVVVLNGNPGIRLQVPVDAKVQTLYAHNCALSSEVICLNNAKCLQELSLQHNNIDSLTFLDWPHNDTLVQLYLDHNRIGCLTDLPPSLQVLSATFNQITDLQTTRKALVCCRQLKQVDFTFNPFRKENGYKMVLLVSNRGLHKIDGVTVTLIDRQIAKEYKALQDSHYELIPGELNDTKEHAETAVSTVDGDEPERSQEQIQKDIKRLLRVIKETEEHSNILDQENHILKQEIDNLNKSAGDVHDPGSEGLYEKLKRECEALELLTYLQYADQEEIESMIMKREAEIGDLIS